MDPPDVRLLDVVVFEAHDSVAVAVRRQIAILSSEAVTPRCVVCLIN